MSYFVHSQGKLVAIRPGPTPKDALIAAKRLSQQALMQIFLVTSDQDHLIARVVAGQVTLINPLKKNLQENS